MYCMPYLISGNVVFLTGTCFYRSNLFERPCILRSDHEPPGRGGGRVDARGGEDVQTECLLSAQRLGLVRHGLKSINFFQIN